MEHTGSKAKNDARTKGRRGNASGNFPAILVSTTETRILDVSATKDGVFYLSTAHSLWTGYEPYAAIRQWKTPPAEGHFERPKFVRDGGTKSLVCDGLPIGGDAVEKAITVSVCDVTGRELWRAQERIRSPFTEAFTGPSGELIMPMAGSKSGAYFVSLIMGRETVTGGFLVR